MGTYHTVVLTETRETVCLWRTPSEFLGLTENDKNNHKIPDTYVQLNYIQQNNYTSFLLLKIQIIEAVSSTCMWSPARTIRVLESASASGMRVSHSKAWAASSIRI